MSEVYLVKHRLRSGKQQVWLDWCKELKKRKDEALATLRNEGVKLEACFLDESEDCVYYFMDVENLDKAFEAFRKSSFPIDREHEKVKDIAFEGEVYLKKLFDLRS